MDDYSAQSSNTPTDKPLVYSEKDPSIFVVKIKNFFKRKSVKIILFLTIVLVIAIPIGLFVNQKYLENKKTVDNYQQAKQKKINLEAVNFGVIGMVGFYGEVKKIQPNEIVLLTKDGLKTIRSNENTIYAETPFVLSGTKKTTNLKNDKKASFSEIKIDDLLDVVANETENDIIAEVITIYRIP